MIIGQLVQVRAGAVGEGHGKGPVEFVHVKECAFLARGACDAAPRWHAFFEHGFVVQKKQRAEGVSPFADAKNFVLRVARPNDVRGVDGNKPVGDDASDVFVTGRGRQIGLSDPIGQRHRHVQILGLDHIRQILQRAVNVRFAGEPAALGHVHPAAELHIHICCRIADTQFPGRSEIFLTSLNR